LGDPTLSQAGVQMTKAIIDIPGRPASPCPIIIVRKNGMPARRAEADLGWRHRSIEARRLSRSCSRLLSRPRRIYEERNALLRYLWQIWTPAV